MKKLKKFSSKLILPTVPAGVDPNWHLFAVRVPRSVRNKIISGLRKYGVEVSFHYLPLHTSVMGKKMGYKLGDLPVTEEVASTLIRLPIYPKIKKSEIDYIVAALGKFL